MSTPSIDPIPKALRQHHQKEDASCAVSAQECIAKMHGFIAEDAFPLQSDPANQKKGFGEKDRAFLKTYRIDAKDEFYDVGTAAALIESEAKAGRYPLVSLIGKDPRGKLGYHTFVCLQHNDELVVIDPAIPAVFLKGKAALEGALAHNSSINPERKTIHILSYKIRAS